MESNGCEKDTAALKALAEAKEKAAKEAEKKLNVASLGHGGYISGKERNSLREQLGMRTPTLL